MKNMKISNKEQAVEYIKTLGLGNKVTVTRGGLMVSVKVNDLDFYEAVQLIRDNRRDTKMIERIKRS
jgi:hypothetical protein